MLRAMRSRTGRAPAEERTRCRAGRAPTEERTRCRKSGKAEMETLESLKRRVERTRDLQSVVKSMKALAAVKIRHFEQTADSVGTYRQAVELGLQVAFAGRFWRPDRTEARESRQAFAIVIGSDQGLCGQFNDQITAAAREQLKQPAGDLIAVGHQVADRLSLAGLRVAERLAVPHSSGAIARTVGTLLVRADRWRRDARAERILLLHNQRRGGASSEPQAVQLWPLDLDWLREVAERPWESRSLPTYRIPGAQLQAALIRQHLFVILFRGLAESMAAEQASRLAAMQTAERDIADRLEALSKRHQQQRQRAITDELLDITSGRRALQRRPR
ncbi:MAG: hypothetical protein GF330_03600 [Candidatus Eisenbacteria bacterium]|nr:hypothetical protein [Candidatus Eisenbacteria bacterium]